MRCRKTGKVIHASKRYALRALRSVVREVGDDVTLNAYKCNHCQGWHLGRMHRRMARRIAAPRLTRLIDKVRAEDRRART